MLSMKHTGIHRAFIRCSSYFFVGSAYAREYAESIFLTFKHSTLNFFFASLLNEVLVVFYLPGLRCKSPGLLNPDAVNKKAADEYAKAIEVLQNDDIKNAIPLLNKAIEYDSKFVDVYLSLGGVYGELKDYNNSILNYRKAFAIDSAYYCKFYLLRIRSILPAPENLMRLWMLLIIFLLSPT